MLPFTQRKDFTLFIYKGDSCYSTPTKQSASLQELAAYAKVKQLECKENPLPWYPNSCGGDVTCYSKDNMRAIRQWVTLVDIHGRSFNDDWAFLTVETFERDDIGMLVRTGLSHYMPLGWAAREVARAREESIAELHSIVQRQVEHGVRQGVARAIEESTANLNEVQSEKQRIDAQIAALQAERERIQAIETRLQERETQRLQREAEKQVRRQNKTRDGYVYLVQSLTALSYYKIGRTKKPEQRMKRFEVKLPFEIQPVCFIETKDMYALEKKLHERFADRRADGEFFALSAADVDYIKSLSNNPEAVRQLLDG